MASALTKFPCGRASPACSLGPSWLHGACAALCPHKCAENNPERDMDGEAFFWGGGVAESQKLPSCGSWATNQGLFQSV